MFSQSFLSRAFPLILFCGYSSLASAAGGPSLQVADLRRDLEAVTGAFPARVGACVQSGRALACVNNDARFSLQSVMKLFVGFGVLEAVDRGRLSLDESVLITKQDLSLNVQPLAKLITGSGFRTTVGDLVRRALVDSDSAATDILIAKLGGPAGVQSALRRKGVKGIRIDRDERHLQTETVGLTWRPEYVDAGVLKEAIAMVPLQRRTAAFLSYQNDVRDTATPLGMASFLNELAAGKLLSPQSTRHLLSVMSQTVTFPDRLKAGLSDGWSIGHKTGTSGSWEGVTVAINDVGLLNAPGGKQIAIAVFVADTKASLKDSAGLMAKISALVIKHYR